MDELLISAVIRADVAVVTQLIAAGADVNTTGRTDMSVLHFATEQEDAAITEALLAAGADVECRDGFGDTPLHCASTACCRVLIAAGADVHAVNSVGWTPLHAGAGRGKADVLAQLVAAGADVNKRDCQGGYTPLHWTTIGNYAAAAECLMAAGADVHAVDRHGETPLEAARRNGRDACALLSSLLAGARWCGLRRAALTSWCTSAAAAR